jgi:hypothetical protein
MLGYARVLSRGHPKTHCRAQRITRVGGERFGQSTDGSLNTLGQEIEAALHCTMLIQEAIPLEENPFLAQLFGSDVLGRFPTAGQDRIRRTMPALIGMNSRV